MTNQTPEQIEADIERQRAQLAGTVDQLSHKLDVKAQGKAKAAQLKDRATTDSGSPTPEVIGTAAGAAVGLALGVLALVWWQRRG